MSTLNGVNVIKDQYISVCPMTSLMRFGISGNTYAISGPTVKGRRNENQDLFAWSVVSGGRIESCIGGEMLRSSAEGRPDMMLALVCDGLGGMRDGAAASRAVAEDLIRWFMTGGPSEDDPNGSLETAIIASDTWLGIRHSGSGTTLSAVMSIGGSWVSAHLGDSEGAPVNTVAEELRQDIEEVMNFKGSDLERQAILYCKRLGINYSKLSELEFRQLIHILNKSSLLKTHGSKRKKRK